MRRTLIGVALLLGSTASAQPESDMKREYPRSSAFEVNVLWPFYPGGLEDLRILVPVLRTDERDWRGEVVLGLSSDFSFGPLSRPVNDFGKVELLTARFGYRQFLAYGLHVEAAVNVGWRHEAHNVHDGTTLDGAYGRLWIFAGYQHEFSQRFYANVRGDAGFFLFRSDRYGYTEKRLILGPEINVGLRF